MRPILNKMRPIINKMRPILNKMRPIINKMRPIINKMRPIINKMRPIINKMHHILPWYSSTHKRRWTRNLGGPKQFCPNEYGESEKLLKFPIVLSGKLPKCSRLLLNKWGLQLPCHPLSYAYGFTLNQVTISMSYLSKVS